jgi:3-oxoacyl-(acyl-carrier-protein) synthase
MMRNILITGIGIISPLGIGSGPLSGDRQSGLAREMNDGLIQDFDEMDYMDSKTSRYCQRAEKLALVSSSLALSDARLDLNVSHNLKIGVALGSMTSNLRAAAIFDRLALRGEASFSDPSLIPSGIMNSLSGVVSIKKGIRGFHVPVASGETSGLQAIQFALMQLETGRVDAALAGGIEEICEDLQLTDYVKNCSKQRHQTNAKDNYSVEEENAYPLSEAAVVLFLESSDNAAQRGVDAYAECVGFGSSYGVSDRKTMLRAALRALERTFCNSNIGHLNTDLIFASLNQNKTGDDIEKEALAQFFGHQMPAVKCVKSLLGDSLGASGVLQVAAAAISIKKSAATCQINYGKAGIKAVSRQNGCDNKPVEQVLVSSFSDEGHMSFLLLRKPNG